METIKISDLIQEGKEIRKGLTPVLGKEGYYPRDYARYYNWTDLVTRFLNANFPDDDCNRQFNNTIAFYHLDYDPHFFDRLISILIACEKIPQRLPSWASLNKAAQSNTETPIWEILRCELKGKDFDMLKEMASKGKELKDNRMLEYLKSLGTETLANILKQLLCESICKEDSKEKERE